MPSQALENANTRASRSHEAGKRAIGRKPTARAIEKSRRLPLRAKTSSSRSNGGRCRSMKVRLKDRQSPRSPIAELASDLASRYRGRVTQGFICGKLRADPILPALLLLPPLRSVLDLGCGRGHLGLALLLAGRADSITGLDLDANKIARATAAADGLPASFAVADLARAPIPPADTVLLIDVLYQMPPAAQRGVLARISATSPARIIIRTADPDRGWRSTVSVIAEHLRRWLGADLGRAGKVAPLPLRDLAAMLEGAGYRVTATPCWAGTPLPNVLMLAERS